MNTQPTATFMNGDHLMATLAQAGLKPFGDYFQAVTDARRMPEGPWRWYQNHWRYLTNGKGPERWNDADRGLMLKVYHAMRGEHVPANRTMPCGWVRTGRTKEHLAHYRGCQHPACQDRLAAWDLLREAALNGMRIAEAKKAQGA